MIKKLHYWLSAIIVCTFALSNHAYAQKTKRKSNNTAPIGIKTFEQQSYRASGGQIEVLLRNELQMANDDKMIQSKAWTDNIGHQHFKYQQEYKGIKVAKSTYSVHAKNGFVKAISGDYLKIAGLNTTPTLNKSLALTKAAQAVKASKYTQLGETELVISRDYETKDGKAHLAYRLVIIAPESQTEVYIDAHTGKTLLRNSLLRSCFVKGHKHNKNHKHSKVKNAFAATAGQSITLYNGTQTIYTGTTSGGYRLLDDSRGNGIHVKNSNNNQNWDFNGATEFIDNDNNWTAGEWDNAAKDAAGMEAFWAYEKTYDYFKDNFNRNSIDNNGQLLRALVHSGTNWFNAQYSSAYVMMRFGDGNGAPLTTIDITSHELTHGVTDFTADLVYSYESGALNESFSDIFGATVEAAAAPNKSRWLMGEDIGHIRDMQNPKSKGDPDTYQGTNWHTSSSDNGGVHTNSGVLNHWFYILTEGKNGTNDIGSSYNVTGIGIDKAAQIAYRMLATYLSANSQYADARTAGIQSAKDLYGAGSNEEIQTTNAFYAVGVGAAYDGPTGSCNAPGSLSATNIGDNTATLNWAAVSGVSSYNVQYRKQGTTAWTSQSASSTSYNATGLATGTAYEFQVSSNCTGGGNSAYSASANFTTTGTAPLVYCASKGNNVSDEYIGKVQFGTIDNTSGAGGGYSDHTSMSTDAPKGSSTTITITPTWTGTVYSEGYSVWIDFNQDGDFEDAGEQVYTQAATKTTPVSGSIAIPSTATLGTTRMRVSMKYNGTPTSCESFSYGEVEDYTVNITDGGTTPVSYCTSKGNNVSDEYINRVQFGSIDNTSGSNNGYADFTSQSTSIAAGGSATVTITPTWTGTIYNEAYSVWIDFNQDGDFEDAGEQVFTAAASKTTPVSGSISIPASAKSGNTRMRVSMKYNAVPTSCETFTYGEVEDYTVNISGGAAIAGFAAEQAVMQREELKNGTTLFPSPATSFTNVQVMLQNDATVSMSIINAQGKVVANKTVATKGGALTQKFDVKNLPAGIYLMKITKNGVATTKRFVVK